MFDRFVNVRACRFLELVVHEFPDYLEHGVLAEFAAVFEEAPELGAAYEGGEVVRKMERVSACRVKFNWQL